MQFSVTVPDPININVTASEVQTVKVENTGGNNTVLVKPEQNLSVSVSANVQTNSIAVTPPQVQSISVLKSKDTNISVSPAFTAVVNGYTVGSGGDGATGATGATGIPGATGPAGQDGIQGPIGPTGVVGLISNGSTGFTNATELNLPNFDLAESNGSITASLTGGATFTQDYILNIPNGPNGEIKSFGKYLNGETIESQGLTAIQVLELAFNDSVDPSPSINWTGQPAYGQAEYTVTLSLNFGILNNSTSQGTNSNTYAVLEWGMDGFGSTTNGGSQTYTNQDVYYNAPLKSQSITFTPSSYSASNNYSVRLTVYEEGTSGAIKNIQKANTVPSAPTGSLITYIDQSTSNLSSLSDNALNETSVRRVYGNSNSRIGIVNSNSASTYVNLSSIKIYGHADSSSSFPETDLLYTISNIGSSSYTNYNIAVHQPQNVIFIYRYKYVIEDEYGQQKVGYSTVNLYPEVYWGTSPGASWSDTVKNNLNAELIQLAAPNSLDGLTVSNLSDNPQSYVWISYYSSYDAISTIVDAIGNETLTGAFTEQSQESITTLNGGTLTYRVYRSNAPNSFDNITLNIS